MFRKFFISTSIIYIFCLQTVGYCGFNKQLSDAVNKGKFKEAENMVDSYVKNNIKLSLADKTTLLFEKDKLNRIKLDYSLTEKELVEKLQTKVKGFKKSEFYNWDKTGYFDKRVIDGKTYYLGPSISNLFFRYKDLYSRAVDWKDLGKRAREHYALCKETVDEYNKFKTTRLKPTTFTISITIKVDTKTIPSGKTIRCWLPYPIEFQRQTNIKLLESIPKEKSVVSKNAGIAYVYSEQNTDGAESVEFKTKFKMTTYAFYLPIDSNKVLPYDKNDEEYKKYIDHYTLHEKPFHELCELTTIIVGDETNPYLKAKKVYDWISDNIIYSYAHEYSTLDNLSKFTFDHKYGDCGEMGMLFITLCKIAGVPARWQSGWTIEPGQEGMHDWAEMYIIPYGWLPVDVHRGSFAKHYGEYGLSKGEVELLKTFFFGNIDRYRLVINNNHSLSLSPEKTTFRSEIVDFQRGELEYDNTNIYFDKFKCSVKAEE